VVGTGYLQKGHSTRLHTTFKQHLQQMEVAMKSIWTGEPNEKQREQRDFVLRHVLYQNRPCLLADYAQGHSGAAMRNKSEDVKELILKGIQAVVAPTTPASGRPTNEHGALDNEARSESYSYSITRECLLASQERTAHRSGTVSRHKPPCIRLMCRPRARARHRLNKPQAALITH
jgi:hypothetical protein